MHKRQIGDALLGNFHSTSKAKHQVDNIAILYSDALHVFFKRKKTKYTFFSIFKTINVILKLELIKRL